ncbi:HAD-IA family hydrolase [Streptomyces griseorubiginosus]|uniref:HAD family hydrolase n=1 Tax=Streptomyces griseorubiginosus TaxID=67304 RepID=UPI0036EF663D
MTVDLDALGCERAVSDARGLLARARGVLFDFDGPICRLFPNGSSKRVADELRELIAEVGASAMLTEDERADKDPHAVLRAVHREGDGQDVTRLLERLEARVEAGERKAALTAWPTRDADTLIQRLAKQGAQLAVVTNNSPVAAEIYLRERRLLHHFATIQGRTSPGLMKPDPDVLLRALGILGLDPGDTVMIGDTSTDVEAAKRAGVPFVGYGRNRAKRARLRDAGAKVVLDSYASLFHQPWQDESR